MLAKNLQQFMIKKAVEEVGLEHPTTDLEQAHNNTLHDEWKAKRDKWRAEGGTGEYPGGTLVDYLDADPFTEYDQRRGEYEANFNRQNEQALKLQGHRNALIHEQWQADKTRWAAEGGAPADFPGGTLLDRINANDATLDDQYRYDGRGAFPEGPDTMWEAFKGTWTGDVDRQGNYSDSYHDGRIGHKRPGAAEEVGFSSWALPGGAAAKTPGLIGQGGNLLSKSTWLKKVPFIGNALDKWGRGSAKVINYLDDPTDVMNVAGGAKAVGNMMGITGKPKQLLNVANRGTKAFKSLDNAAEDLFNVDMRGHGLKGEQNKFDPAPHIHALIGAPDFAGDYLTGGTTYKQRMGIRTPPLTTHTMMAPNLNRPTG